MSQGMRQYLRTYRKRTGLTQKDVALLLGWHTSEKVCRYERLARRPSLEEALAYQVIFGVPLDKLFPGLYQEVERGIQGRARLLLRKTSNDGGRNAAQKSAVLTALAQPKRSKECV